MADPTSARPDAEDLEHRRIEQLLSRPSLCMAVETLAHGMMALRAVADVYLDLDAPTDDELLTAVAAMRQFIGVYLDRTEGVLGAAEGTDPPVAAAA